MTGLKGTIRFCRRNRSAIESKPKPKLLGAKWSETQKKRKKSFKWNETENSWKRKVWNFENYEAQKNEALLTVEKFCNTFAANAKLYKVKLMEYGMNVFLRRNQPAFPFRLKLGGAKVQ